MMMTTMTTTSNFGDAIPVLWHSFWRWRPVRDRRWRRTNEPPTPSTAVGWWITDTGLILDALVETWHDGAAIRCSHAPVFSTFEVVAACVYHAEFDVAVVGAGCSCWSGVTWTFSHDFDDILESPAMSFVPRLVACRWRIREAADAAELILLAGQSRNSQSCRWWSVVLWQRTRWSHHSRKNSHRDELN